MPGPGEPDVLDRERVDAVDAEQHLRAAALARLATTRGDLVHRELHAGARVHPGDRHGARARADRRAQAGAISSGRRGRRGLGVVEAHAPDAPAARRSASSVAKWSWTVERISSRPRRRSAR